MIGKVIEGRFAGEGIHKLPDKNAFYIETAEGKKIGISKKNALSVVDISEQYSVKGCRILCVTWNNYEISIVQLGFPAAEVTAVEPIPMKETPTIAEPMRSAVPANEEIRKGKALVCDMCGSHDLRIQDGMAVCQHCDTCYTLEDVQRIVYGKSYGTRKATRPEDMTRVEKLYILARRAKKDNNTENAAKYYDLIQQEDPSDWEAAFYSTFYDALNTKIAGIESAAHKISNSFHSVLGLIREAELDWKEKYLAIYEMVHMTAGAAVALASGARNHYYEVGPGTANKYKDEARERILSAAKMLDELGNQIENVFERDPAFCTLACLSWRTFNDFLLADCNKKLFDDIDANQTLNKIVCDVFGKIDHYNVDAELDEAGRMALGVRRDDVKRKLDQLEKEFSMTATTKFGNAKFGAGYLGLAVLMFMVNSLFDGSFFAFLAVICLFFAVILLMPVSNKNIESNKKTMEEKMRQREDLERELRKIEKRLNAKS